MNEEQFELYKTHSEEGAKIIESNRMISNSVKQIIYQHHEYFDGSGFPFGIKGGKILTLSNIVALADTFVHIMVDDEVKPTLALRKILTTEALMKKFSTMLIENFINSFIDPAVLMRESRSQTMSTDQPTKRKRTGVG